MWPPAHPFVAYLLYSVGVRVLRAERPSGGATLALVAGAVVPDVVDQPLRVALAGHVGRSVGHSLLIAVPICVAGWLLARRYGRDRVGTAFAVGYLSHLLADAVWPLAVGAFDELGYLLWPITSMPPYTGRKHLLTVGGVDVTTLWVEAALIALATVLWFRDGAPVGSRARAVLPRR